MGETRKIVFMVNYPEKAKNVSDLFKEIRRKIKEIRTANTELEHFSLKDVGMCRLDGGVRITLHFYRENEPVPVKENKEVGT